MQNCVPTSWTPEISRYLRLIRPGYDVLFCCPTWIDTGCGVNLGGIRERDLYTDMFPERACGT
jgi:hypothetical protein